MSKGLGKVERAVLRLCVKCLYMKEQIIKDKTSPGAYQYPGGTRFIRPDTGDYIRGISIGRKAERGRLDDEELIDLKEVHYLYIKEVGHELSKSDVGMIAVLTGKVRFEELSSSQEASYQRAIGALKRKGYIIAGQFPPAPHRFVRINEQKIKPVKRYKSKDNT